MTEKDTESDQSVDQMETDRRSVLQCLASSFFVLQTDSSEDESFISRWLSWGDDEEEIDDFTGLEVATGGGTQILSDAKKLVPGTNLSASAEDDHTIVLNATSNATTPSAKTFSVAGEVSAGAAASRRTVELDPGQTYEIHGAGLLLSDGKPAPSGLDLVVSTLDNAGGSTRQSIVLKGDGTKKNDLSGDPLASYSNDGSSAVTVAVMVDNGQFNAGTGASQAVLGHYTEKIE